MAAYANAALVDSFAALRLDCIKRAHRPTSRSAAIPRHYIRCTDDRTIPPEYQEVMTAGWPAGTVTTLPTSHSPFFAAPAMLAERLIEIARP